MALIALMVPAHFPRAQAADGLSEVVSVVNVFERLDSYVLQTLQREPSVMKALVIREGGFVHPVIA
jgi:hypothetical protein